jgi:Cu/Ag efflux protein CusF
MKFPPAFLAAMPLVLAAAAHALDVAGAAGTANPPTSAPEVHTRAIVRSISHEEGKRLYIRLKLIPRAKIPFSTVTYRVLDARLVAGLREGESVAFRAERLHGENVLTAIHKEAPCQRFEACK